MTIYSHYATSSATRALRMPHHDAGTGLVGASLGVSLYGGEFVYDVFDAYREGLVTNPNSVVAGTIGAGKSAIVKMQVHRSLLRGRRAVVVDPKGEYADLAAAHGVRPASLGDDGWCDPFADDDAGPTLLRTVVASALGHRLEAAHHFVLDEMWRARRGSKRLARECLGDLERGVSSPAHRDVRLALHRLVEGDLAGLVDGTGEPLDLDAELVVVDLSKQWHRPDFGVAAIAAVAAAQRVLGRGRPGHLVIDESWALLSDASALAWLRGSWKLARARAIAHLLVIHRFGDVDAVGGLGSANRAQALGLLREADTVWLMRQPTDEATHIGEALGLHDKERRYLPRLPRGTALVRYGQSRSVVRLVPTRDDAALIDTDEAMRA